MTVIVWLCGARSCTEGELTCRVWAEEAGFLQAPLSREEARAPTPTHSPKSLGGESNLSSDFISSNWEATDSLEGSSQSTTLIAVWEPLIYLILLSLGGPWWPKGGTARGWSICSGRGMCF